MLTIEPDAQTVRTAMHKAARQISRRRPVPGFRPGRAPYAMVERVLGREIILNQALEDIAPAIYRQAIEEAEIEPFEQGQLEIESEDPVVLKTNLPLVPIVEQGDYKSLHIDPEPDVAVTEEQIEEQMEIVRKRHAEYEPVERPVQFDDQVVAKIEGTSDGETVVDQESATIDIIDELTPPGFAEALVGMTAGETREFSLTYPKDFEEEELAGKNVDFSVAVETVRQVNLPELNDDLAKMAGDYDTLTELREGLAENLQRRLESEARQREAAATIAALVEQATVEYPAAALEREVNMAVERQSNRLQQMGFDFEAYLRMIGRTEEELREDLRPEAERSLVEWLVLMDYARSEGLTLNQEERTNELNSLVSSVTARYGERAPRVLEQLSDSGGFVPVLSNALMRKAVEHLTNMLTGRVETELEEGPGESKTISETGESTNETIDSQELEADQDQAQASEENSETQVQEEGGEADA